MSPDERAPKRRPVTRSRAGCLTCRKRRKLCDMSRPECHACKRLSMVCVWPAIRHIASDPAHGRQPELTFSSQASPSNPFEPSPTSSSHEHHLSPGTISHRNHQSSLFAVDGTANLTGSEQGGITIGFPLTPNLRFRGPAEPLSMPGPSTILALGNVSTQVMDTFPEQDMGFGDSNMFPLDDATLQLWAADCLPSLGDVQASNPFDALSSILFPPNPVPSSSIQIMAASPPPSPTLTNTESHNAMLHHYKESLSSLVSCSGEQAPNAFDAFTTMANAAMSSPAGQGLHLSILAWAGRHMVNQGQPKYEAVSERLGSQAAQIIMEKLGNGRDPAKMEEQELLTLFAGLLMLVQFKICRGDVWGFDIYIDQLSRLTIVLYPLNTPRNDLTNIQFQLFENLVYHDTVSSSLLTRGPMVSNSLLFAYARPAIDGLHTLTGVSLQSFCIMHQIADLIRQKQEHTRSGWTDEDLADFLGRAESLEKDLEKEKKRLDALIRSKPNLVSHRYFHEAFRIACLLQLNSFVLGQAPSSLNIRFLVRRSLSLLETMESLNLPGFCSAHWVIFTTAVCAAPKGQALAEADERARADKLYDRTINDLAFLNTSRSRKIVHDVWAKNQNGQTLVDWLDVLGEYSWEIIFA
ncbi:fungal-specific transcription factor domain-domain-containing protein [Naematelia encephala]|uniref:Fungal-specific transcription factor domain-domain-containing protein n=1 Tax=Naematelia encephala TaxID=71784 RepID=A0A1Y2BLW3_9TREE|nr:fungal-specific transcription factor domain-domain-containing protein [Naematelia encephala]